MPQNSKRTILFGQGDDKAIMNPMIPFNCIYDLDFGLIQYMKNFGYTNNKDLVKQEFFNRTNVEIVRDLYSRTDENPLSLCIKGNNDLDDMYNQFMSSDYDNIARSSIMTGIYDLCTLFKGEVSIRACILYSSEVEYYMLSKDDNLKHIELVDLENAKHRINENNIFFFKSLDDMYIDLLTPLIHSSSIYLLDYNYNFGDDGSLKDTVYRARLVLQRNVFNIISAFNRSLLYDEEENEE